MSNTVTDNGVEYWTGDGPCSLPSKPFMYDIDKYSPGHSFRAADMCLTKAQHDHFLHLGLIAILCIIGLVILRVAYYFLKFALSVTVQGVRLGGEVYVAEKVLRGLGFFRPRD